MKKPLNGMLTLEIGLRAADEFWYEYGGCLDCPS